MDGASLVDGIEDGSWDDCVGEADVVGDEEGTFRYVGGDELDGGADPVKLGGDDGVIVGKLEGWALFCAVGVVEGVADGDAEGVHVGRPVGPGVGEEDGSDEPTRMPPESDNRSVSAAIQAWAELILA